MSADISAYLALITSEHAGKPKFVGYLSTFLQGFADATAVVQSIPGLYDLDVAVGTQLDVDGQWIGRSRYLNVPLVGVYFSFDTAGVGFDQGVWLGPFDPTSGLTVLPDDQYRTLLRAVIAANHWDGTIPGAYAALAIVFDPLGCVVLIQDNQDMTMTWALWASATVDAVTLALFTTGELALKPVGVAIDYYVTQSVAGAPFFGFDYSTSVIAGFDAGCWGTLNPGA